MKKFKPYWVPIVFLCLTIGAAYYSYSNMAQAVFSFSVNQKVILIDAGHGGWGPCVYS